MRSSISFLIIILITLSACEKKKIRIDIENEDPIDAVLGFGWTGFPSAPAELTFHNNTLHATSYSWDFGNGQTSSKQTPDKVTYTQAGNYEVILTASNGKKNFLLKRTVVITPNTDPVAHFSYKYKNNRSFTPATILLTNESVNATGWLWEVNGNTYSSEEPLIVFNNPGDYDIKLTAINGNKRSPVFKETVTVHANTDPVAKFAMAYHPFPYVAGEEIQIVNLSTNSDFYEWTFGTNGPAPTNDEHPLVKFPAAGTYTITLITRRGSLVSTPRSINIKINPAP